jgi:anaphase-promoting complex subunit 1
MSPTSRYFNLRLEDLRYVADFYGKVYERRFSGRTENNARPPLLRENTALGALHALDEALDIVRKDPEFLALLKSYAQGEKQVLRGGDPSPETAKKLAWYLQQNNVPPSNVLVVLRELAAKAYEQCRAAGDLDGTTDFASLDEAIRQVLHITADNLVFMSGQGWSVRSLKEILSLWN